MNKRSVKEYRIWKAMKARCYAPSQQKGGYKKNHIQVCDRWLHSYENFIADMGKMPDESYSLERIDVYGDYEPSNCKWIPMNEQPKNRSSCRWYEYEGKRMILSDWAKELGISYRCLYMKMYRGASFEEAVKEKKNEAV